MGIFQCSCSIPFQKFIAEYLKQRFIRYNHIVHFQVAAAMLYYAAAFGINAHRFFYFRETRFQGRRKGSRSNRNMHLTAVPACPLNHPDNPIRFLIEAVETELVHHVKRDQPAGGETNRQPGNIDKRIYFLAFQVSKSKPEIIGRHDSEINGKFLLTMLSNAMPTKR